MTKETLVFAIYRNESAVIKAFWYIGKYTEAGFRDFVAVFILNQTDLGVKLQNFLNQLLEQVNLHHNLAVLNVRW